MSNGPGHLLVALTPHGFGHAAMTAPVIDELRRRRPGLRVTLQTTTPIPWLETRYERPFDVIAETSDFGLVMTSAVAVDTEASAAAYRALHADLDRLVDREAARLKALDVDLVLANIPYVTLLAAKRLGVPAIALSCLNWADIYHAFMGERAEAPAIEAAMLEGYASAATFLRPTPSLPMDRLANAQAIGPLATRGRCVPEQLRRQLGVSADTKVGLIAFGGMDSGFSFADWPRLDGWVWVNTSDSRGHPDMTARERIALSFTDILRSADVVVGKPGYGTFAEAGVNGTPMLTLERPDWPETPFLLSWLGRVGRCRVASQAQMFSAGALAMELQTLLSGNIKPLADPSGCEDAVQAILPWLPRR